MSDPGARICDCERSHNGIGLAERECDCPHATIPPFLIWRCVNCGAAAWSKKKPCNCTTNVGAREGQNGKREQTFWNDPKDDQRNALVSKLRALSLRMAVRVEAIEDRDGKDGAITGRGVGIGYLFARDLATALSECADFIEGTSK